jgi:DNA-binding IclR family transcriptional regulator
MAMPDMIRATQPAKQTGEGLPPVTQTLERGLEVLRAFCGDAKPLGNRTLVERTGLPKATVSRITSTLVNLGYLSRVSSTGRYQLGTGMLSIGNAFLESSDVRRAARPLMQQLATRHNLSIGLAVPDRLNMIYTIWCRSPKTLTLRLTAGSMLPMARTAVGKAYLWALPPAVRRERLAQIKQQEGARAGPIMNGIHAAFDDLDRNGYCIAIAEFQKNTFGIAVPLVLDDGQTIMSLGGGGAKLEVKEAVLRKIIAPDLIRTAAQVQAAIAEAGDNST